MKDLIREYFGEMPSQAVLKRLERALCTGQTSHLTKGESSAYYAIKKNIKYDKA